MEDLKSILRNLIDRNPNLEVHKLRSEVLGAWPEIVGQQVASNCRAVAYMPDKTLVVVTHSNVWMQTLHYTQIQILQKYERRFKRKIVEKIHVKLDSQPKGQKVFSGKSK